MILLAGCTSGVPVGADDPSAARWVDLLPSLADSGEEDTGRPVDSGDSADTGDSVEPFVPDVEVLVIGAGPAGMAAAIEARAQGADVLVLEREAIHGGSATWVGGHFLFSGTPEQAAAGVSDSPAQLLSEWTGFTGGDPGDPWVRYFAEHNVADVRDWLLGMGVTFPALLPDEASGTTLRIHHSDQAGDSLADVLYDQLPADVVRFRAEATGLVQGRDGRIVAVDWTDLDTGAAQRTTAGAIVVATGGFMHDLERVRAVRPALAGCDVRLSAGEVADGSGLDLLSAVGAITQNLDAVGIYAHASHHPTDATGELNVSFMQYVPWVNSGADRFVDEYGTTSFVVGETRAAQADCLAWMVVNAAIAETAGYSSLTGGESFTLDDLSAVVVKGDDLPALAAGIGVDATTLEQTLADWNASQRDADDPYREVRGFVMESGPWYALPVAVSTSKGFGGIDVDLTGRVLGPDGVPLLGVYAAGELTGMAGGSLVGEYGFTGSMSAVLLGARVAGKAAAVY